MMQLEVFLLSLIECAAYCSPLALGEDVSGWWLELQGVVKDLQDLLGWVPVVLDDWGEIVS